MIAGLEFIPENGGGEGIRFRMRRDGTRDWNSSPRTAAGKGSASVCVGTAPARSID